VPALQGRASPERCLASLVVSTRPSKTRPDSASATDEQREGNAMVKIPASIRRKLQRIERLQNEVGRLVAEVEQEMGIADVIDPPDALGNSSQWSWAMHVNQQGKPMTAAEAENLLLRFCELRESQGEG
jgi:hypothetical protein